MIALIKKILNKFIRKSYWYNNIMFADCGKFWNERDFGIELVNLGSTSARAAFNYDGINIDARNWAMSPQSFVGDYEILRNYSCFLKEGATVLIPICPFSCLGGSNADLADKYYTILNIASIPTASYSRRRNILGVMQDPSSTYPLFQLFSRHSGTGCDDFEKDALIRIDSWKHEFSIMDWENALTIVNQDAYNDSAKILSEIVEYCRTQNLRPVIVLPPVSKELRSLFTTRMKKLFIEDFVKQAAPCTRFLNFFDSPDFQERNLFDNSFMLSYQGAKKFTLAILKKLSI